MIPALKGILSGKFLDLPYVRPAATIGTASLITALGLQALGFRYNENLFTATLAVAAVGGGVATGIGGVVYYALITGAFNPHDPIMPFPKNTTTFALRESSRD